MKNAKIETFSLLPSIFYEETCVPVSMVLSNYNICIKRERKKYLNGHFDHWDASLFVRMKLSKKIVQVVQQNDYENKSSSWVQLS